MTKSEFNSFSDAGEARGRKSESLEQKINLGEDGKKFISLAPINEYSNFMHQNHAQTANAITSEGDKIPVQSTKKKFVKIFKESSSNRGLKTNLRIH